MATWLGHLVYKCRFCGAVEEADTEVHFGCLGENETEIHIHQCGDNKYGIADQIGFVKTQEES